MAAKRTYTIAEAADLVGLSRKAVARRVERGSLRSVVRNGRRLIPRSELVRTGLLPDEGTGRGGEAELAELPVPSATPEGESTTALVGLVRDLMERLERQAHEIAQFRALTVQAESLRADRELAELRARLASLESRAGDAPSRLSSADATARLHGAFPGPRTSRANPIWLPPGAAAGRTASAPAPARPAVAEHAPATPGERRWNRAVVIAVEAAFIVVVAVVAGLAQLRPLAIVAVIALAWGLVAVAEVAAWRRRRVNGRRDV